MDRSNSAVRVQVTEVANGRELRREHAQEYARRLVKAIAPKCIILFGSVARDTDREWSDLDLVVVGGDLPGDIFERISRVSKLTRGIRTPADIFPYTEAEFERQLDNLRVTALDCMYEGIPLHGKDYFDRLRPKFEEYVTRGLRRAKAAWLFDKKRPE